MLQLTVLDKNGHSVVTENVEQEYQKLCKLGYASFLEGVQVNELPQSGDVLMLSPIAGG